MRTLPPTPAELAAARVLVVGDAMLDRYWHGAVDRISPEAPVPVVRVEQVEERPGGAANVALNVRALGTAATLAAPVGEDEAADSLAALLAARGVASALGRDARLRTIVKLRVIGRAQQLLRLDFETPPPPEALAPLAERVQAALPAHDLLVCSDYDKGALAGVAPLIAAARASGRPVLIDPKGRDFRRYRGASLITPNRGELVQIVGPWRSEAELAERAQALRTELAIDALLLTRSEEGMSLFDAEGACHVPAQAREVYDVTGAGDTVVAVMAALMAAGWSAREAMPHANRAGGLVVGKFGTASLSHAELFGT